MIRSLKRRFYFAMATYFAFWAKIVLRRWRPRIIVVTGSSGKTTTLHLIESQLGFDAVYSHHANSSFGIPFNILGMEPNVKSRLEWPIRIITTPFHIFRPLPKTRLYVVEADSDRPNEGPFIAKLLKPEVTLWVSSLRTHSASFDGLVKSGVFKTHEKAIAHEFGSFAAETSALVVANDRPAELVSELERVPPNTVVKQVSIKNVTDYKLTRMETTFKVGNQKVHLPGLHTKELGLSVQFVNELLSYLNKPVDPDYRNFELPPGRNNVFQGKKDTILVDSTYNTGLGATAAVLAPFALYPSEHKWLVIGDILEQGSLEQEEHESLAELINNTPAEQVVLIGPRTNKYTLPLIKTNSKRQVVSFDNPGEVLKFLQENLQGKEAILFKGGRFLEGVIEQLLADPKQANQLVRRGKAWEKRRQHWGLPS